MTAPLLSLAVLLIALAGLAWIIAPLLRRSVERGDLIGPDDDLAVERGLRMLDDLQAERDRGAISTADFERVSGDVRRDTARRLHDRDQRRRRLDAAVEALVGGEAPTAVPVAARTPSRARTLAWVAPSVALVTLLGALVVVITVGARSAAAEQVPVGNVGVAAVSGAAVAAGNADLLLVSHATGAQLSRDGGQTWTPAEGPGEAVGAAAGSGKLFVLAGDGVWSSRDQGATWDRESGFPAFRRLAIGSRTQSLAGVEDSGSIFVSNDMGRSWESGPADAPSSLTGLAVVDFGAPFLLAATGAEGVLASESSGGWRGANGFVNGVLPTITIRAVVYEPETGDSYSSASGEQFEGAAFVATDAGVFKSVDGMQSWVQLPLRADVRALAISGRTLYAIATDGSVFRSRDAGTTWR
ncbi:MAG: hypothetical protein OXG17_07375 [Chloroflexi bacterium]|nr:hypothetical protein [Chloroflexota bacterium]